LRVVGVPKTIDNDLDKTFTTFGFDTAVAFATECLDRLHSTAESHQRVMVVEVMGRYAGWIALHAGISGSAHAILIPEIPFDIDKVAAKIRARDNEGRMYSLVMVAEGAEPIHGHREILEAAEIGHAERLGGVGERVARVLADKTGKDVRTVVLGHCCVAVAQPPSTGWPRCASAALPCGRWTRASRASWLRWASRT
jgi:6-phosphofructokinase